MKYDSIIISIALIASSFVLTNFYNTQNLNSMPSIDENKVLRISATSELDMEPNVTTIEIGYNTKKGYKSDILQSEMKSKGEEFVTAIQNLGIESENIKTSRYQLNESYNSVTKEYDIFQGNISYSIKLSDDQQDLIEEVLTVANDVEMNNISTPMFTFEETEESLNLLRNLAIDKAKEKAERIADELDVKISEIVSYSENFYNNNNRPQPFYDFAELETVSLKAASAPAIQEGERPVSMNVTIGFKFN